MRSALRSLSVVGKNVGQSQKLRWVPSSTNRNNSSLTAPLDTFQRRHIGPTEANVQEMLKVLGYDSLEALIEQNVPADIRLMKDLKLARSGLGEQQALQELKRIVSENKVLKSYIGLGYYGTVTPSPILRNFFENPGWYTPYTPYQGEISQGRMESLLNYQTMVTELTGLEYANASLLDEGTAAAEALSLCHNASGENKFFVSDKVHPQTLQVLKTRAESVGLEVQVGDASTYAFTEKLCGALLQYPDTEGTLNNFSDIVDKVHKANGLVVVATDLLSLTLLKPPGEFGADIAIGTAQRFGVPLGFGGPHAAFFCVKDIALVRKIPGRIIGVSVDADGNRAYRMSLQSREQHIRRERATSNICTAQALLANMAAFYGVYHGPNGLKRIAQRVHDLTRELVGHLRSNGFNIKSSLFFDTIKVDLSSKADQSKLISAAEAAGYNLRKFDDNALGISLDETTTLADVQALVSALTSAAGKSGSQKVTDSHRPTSITENSTFARTSAFLTHPVFNSHHSETELLRYMFRLQSKDLGLNTAMVPLGSCTMKLNSASEMIPVTWPEISRLHPFIPLDQSKGYYQLFKELEHDLAEITGFAGVSLQPNAGSQGEYAGLIVIREYFKEKGEGHRKVMLIPISAHGTNPASAVMAGLKVVLVKCDDFGFLDLVDLETKAKQHKENLAGMMVTYPSTYGVFEETIKKACSVIHENGGLVYMDGANMNAQVGLCRPGDIGADVCHLNLHKTFCIPHGGGGPGVGPICVAKHLVPYLPGHPLAKVGGEKAVGPISAAPFGSSSILPIVWMYINMMGPHGLRRASQVAILNANYMKKRLEGHYAVRFTSRKSLVAHEFIIDIKPFGKSCGIVAEDVAKRLMDFNFHAPTLSWPVPETLMIEPTESESKDEIDRLCDSLIQIREEIRKIEDGTWPKDKNPLKLAPHTAAAVTADTWDRPYSRQLAAYPLPAIRKHKFWPSVARINNAAGDRNLVCSCPPLEDYEN